MNFVIMNLIGKQFIKVPEFFIKPCPSSSIGIVYVSDLSGLKIWNLSDIVMKCIMFPYSIGFVVYPFLHNSLNIVRNRPTVRAVYCTNHKLYNGLTCSVDRWNGFNMVLV